jgi:hypothetical protein
MDAPVTMPVVDPTGTMPTAPLVQVPPLVPSVNVVVYPRHTLVSPVMGGGVGLTNSEVVMMHPVLLKV